MGTLKAPFTWFGGKSRAASVAWAQFGDVANYVEPFFGSGAALLARPEPVKGTETVNDLDAYVANFWRAVQAEPEAVAELMNWPVNESDLEARHKWLVTAARKAEHQQRMRDDPDYYSVKIASLWCWGLCQWIGSGWCAGEWHGRGSEDNSGRGVNVRDEARGGKRPHLRNAGMGVHRKRPHLGDAGRGECERRLDVLIQWMRDLQDRLRNVRVCCGDWSRVCGPTPTIKLGTTGVFLDPPYSDKAGRDNDIYRCEDADVAHAVRAWCLEHGGDKRLRIVLCGYEGEHNNLEKHGWRVEEWKAHGGYGPQRSGSDYQNKFRERLWCSLHCVGQRGLFDAVTP